MYRSVMTPWIGFDFDSAKQTAQENSNMLDRLASVTHECTNQLRMQDYSNFHLCVRYMETFNTLMKTFEATERQDMMQIMGFGQ